MNKGYTLVEVLVAMAILSILAVGLSKGFVGLSSGWNLEANREEDAEALVSMTEKLRIAPWAWKDSSWIEVKGTTWLLYKVSVLDSLKIKQLSGKTKGEQFMVSMFQRPKEAMLCLSKLKPLDTTLIGCTHFHKAFGVEE